MNVKICGITSAEDALEAVRLGARYIGFICHAASPRYIAPEDIAAIVHKLPKAILKVGVFVDAQPATVLETVERAGLDIAQLHGDETAAICKASGPRIWKALRVSESTPDERKQLLKRAQAYAECEAILIDAKSAKAHGGTGERSDWTFAAELGMQRPVVLAGGIGAENVREAMQRVDPWAIDVSSSVEDAPGKKSHAKMKQLFEEMGK
jgi:phosphoribosylanthranilate isomerase